MPECALVQSRKTRALYKGRRLSVNFRGKKVIRYYLVSGNRCVYARVIRDWLSEVYTYLNYYYYIRSYFFFFLLQT